MPIRLKRSAVADKVPTTAQLELGELAVNTPTGRLFTKIDNGTPAVVEYSLVGHGHTIAQVSGLQAAIDGKAATSHTHTLANVTDSGAMAAYAEATADQVRGLDTSALGITSRRARDAAAKVDISGSSNWTPDWSTFVNAYWPLTGNRTLNNPTNVIPGTCRTVLVTSSSTTDRAISFGSYYKGNLPDEAVDSTSYVLLTLFAFNATLIMVGHVREGTL